MPITARTISWPERARPKAATAASRGISIVENGPAILCQRLASSAAVGAVGGLQLGDRAPQLQEILLVGH